MRSLTSIAPGAMLAAMLATIVVAPLAARPDDPETELAKMIAGRTAGPPEECFPLARDSSSTIIDRTAAVYRRGTTLYVSRFKDGCPELDISRILVIKSSTGQLCRGDIADVQSKSPAFFVGSCVFGPFIPYAKTK